MSDELKSYNAQSNDKDGEVSSTTTNENGDQLESYVPVKRRRLNDNAFQRMRDVRIVENEDFLYDVEEVRRAEKEDGGGERPTSNNDGEKSEDEYDPSFDVPEFMASLNNEEMIEFNVDEEREAAVSDVQGFDEQFRSRGVW